MRHWRPLLFVLLLACLLFSLFLVRRAEGLEFPLRRTVWILWFQGWSDAPFIQRHVAESWTRNNPTWKVVLLDKENLSTYLDATMLANMFAKEDMSMQAQSDVIRLSLLQRHGGVWADSTMLCMQPLDSWVEKAIQPRIVDVSQFWKRSRQLVHRFHQGILHYAALEGKM